MKDKEKQIEEIAKVLDKCCNFYDKNGVHLGNKCNSRDCEYWCDTNYLCCSYNKKEATALYNAGYRKLPKDSVVISMEEYKKLKMLEEGHITCDDVYEYVVNSRKETVEKDFITIIKALEERKERVHSFYGVSESVGVDIAIKTVKELAKQFGVEIKE